MNNRRDWFWMTGAIPMAILMIHFFHGWHIMVAVVLSCAAYGVLTVQVDRTWDKLRGGKRGGRK